jgi:hypothetical protein
LLVKVTQTAAGYAEGLLVGRRLSLNVPGELRENIHYLERGSSGRGGCPPAGNQYYHHRREQNYAAAAGRHGGCREVAETYEGSFEV